MGLVLQAHVRMKGTRANPTHAAPAQSGAGLGRAVGGALRGWVVGRSGEWVWSVGTGMNDLGLWAMGGPE